MTNAAEHNNDDVTKLPARLVEVEQRNAKLDKRVAHLTKMLFARKSERLADAKHPLLPFPGDEPEPRPPPHVGEAADEEYDEVTYKRKKRGATQISKDLLRETRTIELPEAERRCPCCNEAMCRTGEEVSERLDYTPELLKVTETRRVKYACKQHEEFGVMTPPGPVHPIERGMATLGLLADVLVANYKDHLPLYRQSLNFGRNGAELAESTLGDWVKDSAEILEPVVAAMKQSVLASHVVQSDDTGITFIDSTTSEGSRHSYLRAYVGDLDELVFDFTLGRGREEPTVFLGDYRGQLQVDAYSGYGAVIHQNGLIAVGNWAMLDGASTRLSKVSRTRRTRWKSSAACIAPSRMRAIDRSIRSSGVSCDSPSRSRSCMRCIRAREHSSPPLAQEPDGRRDRLRAAAVGHAPSLP